MEKEAQAVSDKTEIKDSQVESGEVTKAVAETDDQEIDLTGIKTVEDALRVAQDAIARRRQVNKQNKTLKTQIAELNEKAQVAHRILSALNPEANTIPEKVSEELIAIRTKSDAQNQRILEMVEHAKASVPEDYHLLIPSLDPVDQLVWINHFKESVLTKNQTKKEIGAPAPKSNITTIMIDESRRKKLQRQGLTDQEIERIEAAKSQGTRVTAQIMQSGSR